MSESVEPVAVDEPPLIVEDRSSSLMMFGWIFTFSGFIGAFFALNMPTSAQYSDTLNIGLLQNQAMMFHAALASAIAGFIMMTGASIISAIQKAR